MIKISKNSGEILFCEAKFNLGMRRSKMPKNLFKCEKSEFTGCYSCNLLVVQEAEDDKFGMTCYFDSYQLLDVIEIFPIFTDSWDGWNEELKVKEKEALNFFLNENGIHDGSVINSSKIYIYYDNHNLCYSLRIERI